MADNLKHKTKVGLYWKFIEQFSMYGVQFLIGIVMARLLSPSDFGIAALPAVFIAIAQVFIDSGFALALIRKSEVTEKDLSTSFYYSLAVGVTLYLVMFFCAPLIAAFYEVPILTSLIRVSTLTFIWNPLLTPQNVILNRKLDFKTPARISIVNRIVAGVVGISVAYCGFGIWALIASSITASVLGLIQTWIAVKWIPTERWSKNSFSYLWNFGNKMIGSGLLRTLYANLIPVMLGKFGSTAQLGVYNRSRQFASLPSDNLAGIINSVTYPVLSKMQNDREHLRLIFIKMIKVSSFVAFPIMMIMSALSEPLILTLITDKWKECVPLLQIMCFTYMFQPAQILNVHLLQVLGRPDLTLRLEIITKCIFPVFVILAIQHSLIVLCVVNFCITMVAFVMNTYYTGKLIDVGYLKHVRLLFPTLVLSLVTMAAVFFVTSFISSSMMKLFVGGFLGVCFYLVLAYLLKFDELKEVKYMINIKK